MQSKDLIRREAITKEQVATCYSEILASLAQISYLLALLRLYGACIILLMKTDNESLSRSNSDIQQLITWDVCIPFLAAAIPAGFFQLMGFISMGFDKPGIKPPVWIIVSMLVLQVLGMITMAIVILVRFDHGSRKLRILTDGRPYVWRKCALVLTIGCLLLFDLLSNISAAFAGAEFLLAGAGPFFLAYLAFNRIAFAWAKQPEPPESNLSRNLFPTMDLR